MADELEKQANKAFVDGEFELALDLFSQAISADPKNASLLVSRAHTHIHLENFTDAVADANGAIELNPSLSKAYLHKGNACMKLEEYQTARAAFIAGADLDPLKSTFKNFIKKCDAALAEEAASTDNQLAEKTLPRISSDCTDGDVMSPTTNGSLSETTHPASGSEISSVSQATSSPLTKPASKFRHSFYQNANEVVVEIFAKQMKSEDVKVEFGLQRLNVEIKLPSDDPYIFQPRLSQKILVEQCKYKILGTKIEIRLAKQDKLQWKTLEYDEREVALQPHVISTAAVAETKLEYPSSSKKGHHDWDKLEAEIKKQEKDEKLEGDAALNKLFRDIYSSANEDTRRAMNKSFVESNGTVLSTNWKEVGTKYVEGSPPSGMEMKKWEQ